MRDSMEPMICYDLRGRKPESLDEVVSRDSDERMNGESDEANLSS
jgi:hypothetical protein